MWVEQEWKENDLNSDQNRSVLVCSIVTLQLYEELTQEQIVSDRLCCFKHESFYQLCSDEIWKRICCLSLPPPTARQTHQADAGGRAETQSHSSVLFP